MKISPMIKGYWGLPTAPNNFPPIIFIARPTSRIMSIQKIVRHVAMILTFSVTRGRMKGAASARQKESDIETYMAARMLNFPIISAAACLFFPINCPIMMDEPCPSERAKRNVNIMKFTRYVRAATESGPSWFTKYIITICDIV